MFRHYKEGSRWSREATDKEIREAAERRNLSILEFMIEGQRYKWSYRALNVIIQQPYGDLCEDTGHYIQWHEPWRDKVRGWLCRLKKMFVH